jgi:3'(2'), 5'-bisphosphate nucleotidase
MIETQPDFGPYARQAGFAQTALRQAAALCMRIQAESTRSLIKADLSPVTVADFAVQAVVAGLLGENFPDDPLIAEEDSAALRAPGQGDLLAAVTRWAATLLPQATPDQVCRWIDRGGARATRRAWTLDPIDGTKGFLRGDQYVVALALLEAGQVVLAGLGCPRLSLESPGDEAAGVLLLAARGRGAWSTPLRGGPFTRVTVSTQTSPAAARLLRSYEAAHTDVARLDRVAEALGTSLAPLRMDSQAKYAMLAAGLGEAIVRIPSPLRPGYEERIWDHAAGALVVEEAGGKVTDLRGRPLDFGAGRTLRNNLGVLATNGRLHAAALQAVAAVGADRPAEAGAA